MSRYYGYDIINAIKTRLEDSIYGVNAYIAIINATRSESAPLITQFLKGSPERQWPEGYIDLKDSDTEETVLSSNIELLTETYPAEITIINNDSNTKLKEWAEIHIEALQKCLHGYSDANITAIICTGTIREELYDQTHKTYILCGIKINVEIN